MGGRHSTAVAADRLRQRSRTSRRRPRRGFSKPALVITALVAVLAAGTVVAFAVRTNPFGCLGSRTELAVAAAPDIAPALDKIAARFGDSEFAETSPCVHITVTSRDPYQVAQEIRSAPPGDDDVDLPHVWVADSTLWLDTDWNGKRDSDRLGEATPVAHSPLVIAMIRPLADRLQWEKAGLSWIQLITQAGHAGQSGSNSTLQLGIVDPTRSAVSTAGLVGVRNGTAKPDAEVIQIAAIRALNSNIATTERSLLDQLPRTPNEVGDPALKRLHALPLTEQGVWRYNISGPAVPLASVYPADGAPVLDYPYVRVKAVKDDKDRDRAAEAFLRAVQSPEGRRILQSLAFRSVDDEAGVALSPISGARQQKPPGAYQPKATDVAKAQQVWATVNLNARMLAVIDVSGSMLRVDPGARRSRIVLTREGAAQGLGLLAQSSEVGLWVFSTDLTPSADYAEVMGVGRLGDTIGSATRRDILLARLGGLNAKKGGATGLYDTALAAYRTMVRGYNPKAFNSVVLFTDGRNEDPSSITLDQLLTELRNLRDPKRPVSMYTIGFGNEIDAAALKAIAEATGGRSTVTTNPLAMKDAFLKALAQGVCDSSGCNS